MRSKKAMSITLFLLSSLFIPKDGVAEMTPMTETNSSTRQYLEVEIKRGQTPALIYAILSFLHSNFKTRYLGYKDGFLFLPEISFWKKNWQKKFYKAWRERSYLKYRYLITNI